MVTTRESDATVDPTSRAEIANHANAQACLSLHATESGSGVHLFASSLAPAQPARLLAWKTAQAAWVTRSLALAGVLNSALLHAGMNVTLGRTALPAMDSMTCPAVAVEIAPEHGIRQDSHRRARTTPDYQARVAAGAGRRAPRVAHRCRARGGSPAMIPRYQNVLFIILLLASLAMGVAAVASARARPPAPAGRRGFRAHQRAAKWRRPSRRRLLVANDSDGSLLTAGSLAAAAADPGARARAVLGKLLDLYAAPDAAHPVPGGAARCAQVFLLPASGWRRPRQTRSASAKPDRPATGGRQPDRRFAASHPSGIETETLTVLSICGTLHANLPRVTQVGSWWTASRAPPLPATPT